METVGRQVWRLLIGGRRLVRRGQERPGDYYLSIGYKKSKVLIFCDFNIFCPFWQENGHADTKGSGAPKPNLK